MNPAHPLAHKVKISQGITYTLFASLLVLFVYWNLNRGDGFNFVVFAAQTLPLLLLIPGMFTQAYRAYSWLCFLMLFYFIFAVQLVFTSTRSVSDFIFLTLVVLLFCSSMMLSRWLQRLQKNVT